MGEIDKATFLSGHVCITAMIAHVVLDTAVLYVGTLHEHDWVFYHDALSLLIAHGTIA